jgi:AraC-like DNA-binding protein
MRQDEPFVRGYAVTHPPGEARLPSQAGWHQVLYARSGGLLARTDDELWTVPPDRVLCIGTDTTMRVRTRGRTAVRCLYFDASLGAVPAAVRVVTVTPLVGALLLDAVERSPLDRRCTADAALVTLLVERLAELPAAPLRLRLPTDGRARTLADLIAARPADDLASLIDEVPASRRTIERIFRAEVHQSPAAWQRRVRVLRAVELLGEGADVTTVAADVGYATPSSFGAAFRAETGTTPRQFSRRRHG